MMMVAGAVTVCIEYMSATTVATKQNSTINISSSRMIHRGVVLTLNDLKSLKSSSLFISLSIMSVFILRAGKVTTHPSKPGTIALLTISSNDKSNVII